MSRSLPPGVLGAVRLAGGVNRFGKPNYQCVWGEDRFEWIGGLWKDWSEHGTIFLREVFEARYVRKYQPPVFHSARWYVEKWMPPEAYGSRDSWERNMREYFNGSSIAAAGCYPSHGDYEHIFTVVGPNGSFVQITPEIARLAIELNKANAEKTVGERMRDRYAREQREEKESRDRIAAALDEVPISKPSEPFKKLVRKMAYTEGIVAHVD